MNHWIERAREGDRTATAVMVDRLRPRVEKMAAYYARRCGEDADDLLQEAWVGLLEAVPALDLRIGSPEQYLLKRAKWRLLDAVKRARIRRCAPLDEEQAEVAVGRPAEDALGQAHVVEFLAQLKAGQREIVRCLLEGLTWREAGSVLGCTSANIAYHMRQIKRQYEAWDIGTEPPGARGRAV
jgi:RNA polymerase sigma factor (sigma-70 family)